MGRHVRQAPYIFIIYHKMRAAPKGAALFIIKPVA